MKTDEVFRFISTRVLAGLLVLNCLLSCACTEDHLVELEGRPYNLCPTVTNDSLFNFLSQNYLVDSSNSAYQPGIESLLSVTTFMIIPIRDSTEHHVSDISLRLYSYSNFVSANKAFETKCDELRDISRVEFDANDEFHPGVSAYPNYYLLSGNRIYLLSATYSAGEFELEQVFEYLKKFISCGGAFEKMTIVKLRNTGGIVIN